MAYNYNIVIKETHVFTRVIQQLLPDDEYRKLQEALIANPKIGDVIRASGGLRKMRWSMPGKGKRGGVRVIYYYLNQDSEIFMIYAYQKNAQNDLTKEQLKQLKTVVDRELGK